MNFAPVIVLSVVVVLGGCSTPSDSPPPAAKDAAVAAIGGASGRFAGSQACRPCHAGAYDAWSTSRHRATLRPWREGQPLRLAADKLPSPYRMEKDGAVFGPGVDGKEISGSVAFLVGGRHREDALIRLADGRLQVFPIAFDADRGKAFEPLRELAGGIPPPSDVVEFWTRMGRNADLACYGCHATGQILLVAGQTPTGSPLPSSKWVEPGVGCEACHGPGGPHIDAARADKPGAGNLKMKRGEAASMVDACAACHGLRDVLISPFRSDPAHRYGESIVLAADPLLSVGSNSEFRNPFFADLRPSTYQQEAIAFSQSGCARKGGMTCAACHDVHSGAMTAKLQADDGGTAICAPCHAAVVALGAKHALHPNGTAGGRCLDCHMARILRGPAHDAARDHSMAPPVAGPGEIPAACAGCHAGGKNAKKVTAAWEGKARAASVQRRLEVIAAIDASTKESPGAAAALARLLGDPDRGWFLRWAALQNLASGRSGPAADEVLEPVRRALTDPNPALRRAAAGALANCGVTKDIEALQRASDDVDPWAALAAAYAMGRLGAPTAGARLLQLLKRPDLIADARAQYQYGHACLVGQDAPRAEVSLRRALELNPLMVGAINDLGLALMAQHEPEQAKAAWKRALDINPRFTAAQRNLETAKP